MHRDAPRHFQTLIAMAAGACDHYCLTQTLFAMTGGATRHSQTPIAMAGDALHYCQTPIAMVGDTLDHSHLPPIPIAMAQHTPLPYTACGTAARSTLTRFHPAQAPLRCWTQRMSCLEAWEDAMYDSQTMMHCWVEAWEDAMYDSRTTIACVPSMRYLEVGEEADAAMSHSHAASHCLEASLCSH